MRPIEPQLNEKGQQVLICTCCGKEKLLKLFTKNRSKCKECTALAQLVYSKNGKKVRSEEQLNKNRLKQLERNRINRAATKYSSKRKRVFSVNLYSYNLYAKFTTEQAQKRYKIQIEYDSLWDKFCRLESLISPEAFQTIERINKIEYLTV